EGGSELGRLRQPLGRRGPPDRNEGVRERRTHQGPPFAEQEDLRLVTRLDERVGVQERKRGLGRVVRPPRALEQDLHDGRPRRSARPGSTPVCCPLSTTTWPLTIT